MLTHWLSARRHRTPIAVRHILVGKLSSSPPEGARPVPLCIPRRGIHTSSRRERSCAVRTGELKRASIGSLCLPSRIASALSARRRRLLLGYRRSKAGRKEVPNGARSRASYKSGRRLDGP